MSTYEDDHNIRNDNGRESNSRSRRTQETDSDTTFSRRIESFLTRNNEGTNGTTNETTNASLSETMRSLNVEERMQLMLEILTSMANSDDGDTFPDPKTSKGVPQDFVDTLQRIDQKDVPNSDTAECPICTSKFIDDKHPLIVELPCNASDGRKHGHIFDLECIEPWLKVQSTCPLCRFDVLKASEKRKERLERELKEAREQEEEEEEEDDEWELYG